MLTWGKQLELKGGIDMLKLVDGLAGAIQDGLTVLVKAASYFLAGLILVGAPLWLLAKTLEWISATFF